MSVLCGALQTESITWETVPREVREDMLRWTTAEVSKEQQEILEHRVRISLRYNPLFAPIASLGLFDIERNQKILYTTSTPKEVPGEWDTVRVCEEVELLGRFWEGVVEYQTFVVFNGFQYVWPFLYHRSHILDVLPSVVTPRRGVVSLQATCQFVDLTEVLTFGRAWNRRPSLLQYAHAYGVFVPKEQGIYAELPLVATLYKRWGNMSTKY